MIEGLTFIAFRHGDHNGNGLSPLGVEQIERAVQKIKEIWRRTDQKIILLCSTAPRAIECGRIILALENLGMSIEHAIFTKDLWDDSGHFAEETKVNKLLDKNLLKNKIVLVVSHLDLVPCMLNYVATKFGHGEKYFSPEYGEGSIIDSEGVRAFP